MNLIEAWNKDNQCRVRNTGGHTIDFTHFTSLRKVLHICDNAELTDDSWKVIKTRRTLICPDVVLTNDKDDTFFDSYTMLRIRKVISVGEHRVKLTVEWKG